MLNKALQFFLPHEQPGKISRLGQGRVNDTWLLTLASEQKLVLQRLPVSVFPDPEMVMHNYRLVTNQLHSFSKTNQNLAYSFLRLQKNPAEQDLFLDSEKCGWRLCSYIANTKSLERLTQPEQGYQIGCMLGTFHRALSPLEQDLFVDPLPDFHNTIHYLKMFDQVLSVVPLLSNLEKQCIEKIERLRRIGDEFHAVADKLTHHIIHGDPKAANFLFGEESNQVISLVDLDTVKPDLLLHDLGDCLRSCCNHQGEEAACDSISFRPMTFQAVLQGYAAAAGHLLTDADIHYLIHAVRLLCFELGVRFFTDHLQGDIYFKTTARGRNLARATTQFRLADSINEQWPQLENIVNNVFTK